MNKISSVTRQRIADEMSGSRLHYSGGLQEPDFLGRLFKLKDLRSNDYRFRNAYDDIHQHTVMNSDYDDQWIYTDARIDMLHCEDEKYLEFLSLTLHPKTRRRDDEIPKLLELYNRYISVDGFEIKQSDEISGAPIFSGRVKTAGAGQAEVRSAAIKKFLDTDYVNKKIAIMQEAISSNTELAIGTAKELLETTCKSILIQKGIGIDKDWSLPKLTTETANSLDFTPKETNDAAKAEKSIRQILSGIGQIIQGVAELRNSYGSGHGKDENFKALEEKYARFLVGVVSDIVILFLATNGETAELVS